MYRRLWPILHARARVALRVWGKPRLGSDDADDLAMRAAIHLLEDGGEVLKRWRPELGRLETWAGRVSWNLYVDRLRTEGRRGALFQAYLAHHHPELGMDAPPDVLVEQQERLALVLACVEARIDSELGRQILARLYTAGQTDEVIQAELEVTREVVFRWRSRIKTLEQECRAKIEDQV